MFVLVGCPARHAHEDRHLTNSKCFLQARNPKFILIVKVYMVGIAPIIRFSCFGSSMKYDDGSRQAGPNAAR